MNRYIKVQLRFKNSNKNKIYYFNDLYRMCKFFNSSFLPIHLTDCINIIIDDWERYKRYEWDKWKFIKLIKKFNKKFG